MYCNICGNRIDANYSSPFCPYCGAELHNGYTDRRYKKEKTNSFLLFLVPAAGAAVILVMLFVSGVINLDFLGLSEKTAYAQEYTVQYDTVDDRADESGEVYYYVTEDLGTAKSAAADERYDRAYLNGKSMVLKKYMDDMPPVIATEEIRNEELISEPTATPAPQPTETPAPEPTTVPEPTATPAPEPTTAPQPTATPAPEPTTAPAPSGALRFTPAEYMSEPFSCEQILPQTCCEDITGKDLSFLTESELRIARNEIYARHGRKFLSEDLQRYFASCTWYLGTIEPEVFDANENCYLSAVEKRNIEYIVQVEASRQV